MAFTKPLKKPSPNLCYSIYLDAPGGPRRTSRHKSPDRLIDDNQLPSQEAQFEGSALSLEPGSRGLPWFPLGPPLPLSLPPGIVPAPRFQLPPTPWHPPKHRHLAIPALPHPPSPLRLSGFGEGCWTWFCRWAPGPGPSPRPPLWTWSWLRNEGWVRLLPSYTVPAAARPKEAATKKWKPLKSG